MQRVKGRTTSGDPQRRDRAVTLLDEATPWDLIVLDEAHHARRRGAGREREGGPNVLMKLIRTAEQRPAA